MRLGIHVRIDAKREARNLLERAGPLFQDLKFRFRLDIELEDIVVQALVDFLFRLSHSRKDDLPRCASCFQGPHELAAGNDVESSAHFSKQAQDGEVGACLHRVADKMRKGAERSIKNPEMPLQRSLTVQVKRGTDLSSYSCNRDILTVKLVFLVLEVVHESSP